MISLLMDRKVEHLRPARSGVDRLGNPVTTLVRRGYVGCRLEQNSTREDDTDAFEVATWRGYFPAGTDLRNGDQLRADGLVFHVEGTPAAQSIPGAPFADHVLATLRLVREVE